MLFRVQVAPYRQDSPFQPVLLECSSMLCAVLVVVSFDGACRTVLAVRGEVGVSFVWPSTRSTVAYNTLHFIFMVSQPAEEMESSCSQSALRHCLEADVSCFVIEDQSTDSQLHREQHEHIWVGWVVSCRSTPIGSKLGATTAVDFQTC